MPINKVIFPRGCGKTMIRARNRMYENVSRMISDGKSSEEVKRYVRECCEISGDNIQTTLETVKIIMEGNDVEK